MRQPWSLLPRAEINDDRAGGLDALACGIDSRAIINDDRASGNDALAY